MFDLSKREEEILALWEADDPIKKLRTLNKDKKKFFFLDGPPYLSGPLAAHHAWVAAIKDLMLRYKRYRGYNVHDRAGFDVHGLPTEVSVEKKFGIKSKDEIESSFGVARFIEECEKFTDFQIGNAVKVLKRYGSTLNFDDKYLPYTKKYIESAWAILKKISDKGLLYRSTSVLAYCPHCQTVFSNQSSNIEYSMTPSPSIYVAFKIVGKNTLGLKDASLAIWTTTPWTIPANIAVAVNPSALYIEAIINGRHYVVAKERLQNLQEAMKESATVVKEFYGSSLEGVHYLHPLEGKLPVQKGFRKYHKVIASAELANTIEGTGLVHIAPGHGTSDYELGKRKRLPVFSPVDSHAKYTSELDGFAGLSVPDEADARIIKELEDAGAMLARQEITHSYPHCERCHSKLIYIATPQWFINIQRIKAKTIKANRKIVWHPSEGGKWQEDSLRSSPDWCISRQRYFGIPLPIWVCSKCGSIEVIESLEKLNEKALDKGKVAALKDLHKPYIDEIKIKCSKCGAEMDRVPDVFDVWYDSGIAHTASLTSEEFEKM
ncbi:MAG: class I tRNA ligase family protein, partial [Candidatus Micrarchaeaceae archaeon]